MARDVTIGGNGTLFVGEDKTFRHEILSDDIPVDMTGWAVQMVVHSSKGQVLINKTATVAGVYSATQAANLQRATITLTDTEMDIPPGTHRHSLKRTDDGSETVLSYGKFIVESATQV